MTPSPTPGSFDDVVLAYDLGWLSGADYDVLASAADGLPAPEQIRRAKRLDGGAGCR